MHDERQLRKAIDALEYAGSIELIDQRTAADGVDFASIGDRFRRYTEEELRGISREWSQGSPHSTADDARWNQFVVLTEKGHTTADAMRAAYANDAGRRNAARDALPDYLYKGNHPILWDTGFEQDPRGFYMGQRFRKKDSHDAAYYLREKGLIREIETSTLLGDTVEITGDGIDCIERHAGSVSRFLNPKGIPMVNIDNVSQPGVFISYVREDSDRVDSLQRTLEAAGVPVWRDVTHLWPGEDWRARIRYAITRDSIVFIACFSNESNVRRTSYQREELLLAIDQLRLRRPDDPWFIPIRFDDCSLPDLDIGGGRSLASIQGVDLFGDRRDEGIARPVTSIRRILGPPRDQGHTELQQAPIQASARRAEVWPGVDREASMGFTPDWYLVLENTGDAPALDVRASFSFARGYDRYPDYFNRFGDDYEGRVSHRAVSGHGSTWELRDTSSSQEPDIERLAPRSRQRFRLLIDEESPRQMNCTVSWADERGRHENTATLRLE